VVHSFKNPSIHPSIHPGTSAFTYATEFFCFLQTLIILEYVKHYKIISIVLISVFLFCFCCLYFPFPCQSVSVSLNICYSVLPIFLIVPIEILQFDSFRHRSIVHATKIQTCT
jgi:hypothetical protein